MVKIPPSLQKGWNLGGWSSLDTQTEGLRVMFTVEMKSGHEVFPFQTSEWSHSKWSQLYLTIWSPFLVKWVSFSSDTRANTLCLLLLRPSLVAVFLHWLSPWWSDCATRISSWPQSLAQLPCHVVAKMILHST